jgi:hypothetical protein
MIENTFPQLFSKKHIKNIDLPKVKINDIRANLQRYFIKSDKCLNAER